MPLLIFPNYGGTTSVEVCVIVFVVPMVYFSILYRLLVLQRRVIKALVGIMKLYAE